MVMQETLRLRKRAEFLAVRTGEKHRGPLFMLEVKKRTAACGPVAGDLPRVGFTVTRRNGNAAMRNRIRRRLREAVRVGVAGDLAAGTDYVIVARPEIIDVSFDRLVQELRCRIRRKTKNRQSGTDSR